MKKILLAAVVLILFAGRVFAHEPSAINLSYDPETKILKADIIHPTTNMRKHHIRLVKVYKNGEEMDSKYVPRQISPEGYKYETKIDAQPGDVLSVKAYCSDGGEREESLTLEQPAGEAKK